MPSAWISWQKCSNAFDLKKLEIKKSLLIPRNIPAHIFGILHTSFSWIKSFLVTWCTYLRSGQLRHSTSPPFNFHNNWCPIRIIPFRLPGSFTQFSLHKPQAFIRTSEHTIKKFQLSVSFRQAQAVVFEALLTANCSENLGLLNKNTARYEIWELRFTISKPK